MSYRRYSLSNLTRSSYRRSHTYLYSTPARALDSQSASSLDLVLPIEDDNHFVFEDHPDAMDASVVARVGLPHLPVSAPFHWSAGCPYSIIRNDAFPSSYQDSNPVAIAAANPPDEPESQDGGASHGEHLSRTGGRYEPPEVSMRYTPSPLNQKPLQISGLDKVPASIPVWLVAPARIETLIIAPISLPDPNAPAPRDPTSSPASPSPNAIPSSSSSGGSQDGTPVMTPPEERSDEDLADEYQSRDTPGYQGPDLSLNSPPVQGATPSSGSWRVELVNGQRVIVPVPAQPPLPEDEQQDEDMSDDDMSDHELFETRFQRDMRERRENQSQFEALILSDQRDGDRDSDLTSENSDIMIPTA